MKTSALSNGIKITAGSFLMYAILISVLMNVKSLVPNSANMLSGNKGQPLLNQNHAVLTLPKDSSMVLRVEHMFNKRLLLVSLNSVEQGEGRLKIFDLNGKAVLSANIELIRYPYYATVDITGLSHGAYVVIVKSNTGANTSNLIIE